MKGGKFKKVGRKKLFSENKGEILNFESMTKKGHQKFWWMKIKFFWGGKRSN